MSEKLLLKEKIEIIKLSKHITIRINKIFDLIRLTRVNTVFSKRKYLHFIIIPSPLMISSDSGKCFLVIVVLVLNDI